ncbi:WD40/YVTN/BNR-like repeat-containing protein [Neptunicella sp. SCSIO 80796]|uniref:WD40/YVTN/BNR-like repeat-containing protein n=1 Tax=Neptunicella plasticusilytica TaxID=3117012 RepID=UPI003A4DD11A
MKTRNVSFLAVCICILCFPVAGQTGIAYMAPLAKDSLLLDIEPVSSEKIIAVGERGHILESTNGLDWQQQAVPTTATLTGAFFLDSHLGWVVGHDATILVTHDGGQNWVIQQQFPELEKPLMDIHFFDAQHGIAIGAYGLFYRTENGGESWNRELHAELLGEDDRAYLDDLKAEDEQLYTQELSSILPHLNRLSSVVDGRIYMAGEAGLLAYSDDRGQNWQRMDVDYYGSFFAVQQQSSGKVLTAGLRGNIFRFSDDHWLPIDSHTTSSFNSIVDLAERGTLFVGNNGRMLILKAGKTELSRTADGKAIVDALVFKGQIIAATEAGIKLLDLK